MFIGVLVKMIHFIVCIGLIVIVLLQADKGEGLAGAFGGGSAGTIFGDRSGGNAMTKLTTGIAVVFMITSLLLSIYLPVWTARSSSGIELSSPAGAPMQSSEPISPSAEEMPGEAAQRESAPPMPQQTSHQIPGQEMPVVPPGQ